MARKGEANVGKYEVQQIMTRMKEINLSFNELAKEVGITSNGLKKILSNKDKGVKKENLDKIMEVLSIGVSDIFKEIPDIYNENKFLNPEMRQWRGTVFKATKDERAFNELTKLGKIIENVHKFGYTTIIDEIARGYDFVESFFKDKTSFLPMPLKGYWKKFHTFPDEMKNCYINFKLIPKERNAHFKIAYTLGDLRLKNNPKFNFRLPKIIKITYAEIIVNPDYITVIQYYNTPSKYKVKNLGEEISVFTWLDKAEHQFIISCNCDFNLSYEKNKEFDRNKVSLEFSKLTCVVFQRHPYFHREKIGDISDDVKFFWMNENFLNFNPEIRDKL